MDNLHVVFTICLSIEIGWVIGFYHEVSHKTTSIALIPVVVLFVITGWKIIYGG